MTGGPVPADRARTHQSLNVQVGTKDPFDLISDAFLACLVVSVHLRGRLDF
jgi:hypothetical protein